MASVHIITIASLFVFPAVPCRSSRVFLSDRAWHRRDWCSIGFRFRPTQLRCPLSHSRGTATIQCAFWTALAGTRLVRYRSTNTKYRPLTGKVPVVWRHKGRWWHYCLHHASSAMAGSQDSLRHCRPCCRGYIFPTDQNLSHCPTIWACRCQWDAEDALHEGLPILPVVPVSAVALSILVCGLCDCKTMHYRENIMISH